MADTVVQNVHTNAALTNLSLSWTPEGMIARKIIHTIPVKHESDFYYRWRAADRMRRVDTRRADGTRANMVAFGFERDSYLCEEYALEAATTKRERDNADSILMLESNKTRGVQGLVELDLEARVAALFTSTANYASTNWLNVGSVATNQWNNASFAGSIEKVFTSAKDAVRLGTYNNAGVQWAIIPQPVADVIKLDAKVRDMIKYTDSTLLVNGDLPPRIWNLSVVIPTAVEQTGIDVFGAADPLTGRTDVWGKHVVLTMQPHAPGMDQLAHAYIFQARPWLVTQWEDQSIDTTFYRVGYIQTEKIVCNTAGYLLQNVIA